LFLQVKFSLDGRVKGPAGLLLLPQDKGSYKAAALDVTEPEPIPADHPLVKLPSCLIVPHIASASIATRGKMAEMAARNLIAGVTGERLPTLVNPDVYEKGIRK